MAPSRFLQSADSSSASLSIARCNLLSLEISYSSLRLLRLVPLLRSSPASHRRKKQPNEPGGHTWHLPWVTQEASDITPQKRQSTLHIRTFLAQHRDTYSSSQTLAHRPSINARNTVSSISYSNVTPLSQKLSMDDMWLPGYRIGLKCHKKSHCVRLPSDVLGCSVPGRLVISQVTHCR